jgi:hypothetical protein
MSAWSFSNGRNSWPRPAPSRRSISEGDLISGARIVTAANVVEQLMAGAASMDF